MQNNNMLWWTMVITLILTGFIIGWTTKPSGTVNEPFTIKIHDTLKTKSVQYKIIPGSDYNIDSLIIVINQFWKDSLKNMYGKGLFQAKYSKQDDLGKREYTFASRIPLDPDSKLVVDESFIIPKRTFGLIGSVSTNLSASLGLRYYMIDSNHFSLTVNAAGNYLIESKKWVPLSEIEAELRF